MSLSNKPDPRGNTAFLGSFRWVRLARVIVYPAVVPEMALVPGKNLYPVYPMKQQNPPSQLIPVRGYFYFRSDDRGRCGAWRMGVCVRGLFPLNRPGRDRWMTA